MVHDSFVFNFFRPRTFHGIILLPPAFERFVGEAQPTFKEWHQQSNVYDTPDQVLNVPLSASRARL